MGYVFMAVALSAWTVMAFVYRWAQSRQADRMVMSAGVGIAGTAWVVAYVLGFGIDLRLAHPVEWIIGVALGVSAVVGVPAFLAAVARGDLSVSWTLLALSFAPVSVMSVLYPGETVSAAGVAGLALAAAAVVLLGLDMAVRHRADHPSKPRKGWWLFISIAFGTNILTLYAWKLADALPKAGGAEVSTHASVANVAALMLTSYAVLSALAPVGLALAGRRGSAASGVGLGALGGTLLCAGSFSIMFALGAGVPAYLVFPITNGGANVLVVVLSVALLKERPGRWGVLGIVAGIAALACLAGAAA